MEYSAKVRTEQFDVTNRLETLGLSLDILSDVVRAGYHAWSNCTDIDPPLFPGLSMWANMVRRSRERLLPKGWSPCDDGNYSTILSPCGGFALAIATGDENTGNVNFIPATQSPKGPRTVDAVRVNSKQLTLDLLHPSERLPTPAMDKSTTDITTWILLVRRCEFSVHSEVSLPLHLDEQQRVKGWKERLILPSNDFAPDDDFKFSNDIEEIIDIPVRRRV